MTAGTAARLVFGEIAEVSYKNVSEAVAKNFTEDMIQNSSRGMFRQAFKLGDDVTDKSITTGIRSGTTEALTPSGFRTAMMSSIRHTVKGGGKQGIQNAVAGVIRLSKEMGAPISREAAGGLVARSVGVSLKTVDNALGVTLRNAAKKAGKPVVALSTDIFGEVPENLGIQAAKTLGPGSKSWGAVILTAVLGPPKALGNFLGFVFTGLRKAGVPEDAAKSEVRTLGRTLNGERLKVALKTGTVTFMGGTVVVGGLYAAWMAGSWAWDGVTGLRGGDEEGADEEGDEEDVPPGVDDVPESAQLMSQAMIATAAIGGGVLLLVLVLAMSGSKKSTAPAAAGPIPS